MTVQQRVTPSIRRKEGGKKPGEGRAGRIIVTSPYSLRTDTAVPCGVPANCIHHNKRCGSQVKPMASDYLGVTKLHPGQVFAIGVFENHEFELFVHGQS